MRLAAIVTLAACGNNPARPSDAAPTPDARAIDAATPDVLDAFQPDAAPDAFAFAKTQVGAPTFDVTDPFLFAAPIGTLADNFAEQATSVPVLIPHHVYDATNNIFKTKDPHAPPYDSEETDNLGASGYATGNVFHLADWTAPQGLTLAITAIPNATAATGVTPDGSLPMIANALGPIASDGDLFRDGVLVDPNFDGNYPPSTVFAPNTDGYSHIPFVFSENTEFLQGPNTTGVYSWTVKFRDNAGNGWDITAGPMYVF